MGNLRRLHESIARSSFVPQTGMQPLWLDTFAEHLRQSGMPAMDSLGDSFDEEISSFLNTRTGEVLEKLGSLLRSKGQVVATRLRILANGYNDKAMLSLRAT